MGLHINKSWKVLIGTLGLSLVGCGGAALETEDMLGRAAQKLDGAVTLTLNGDAYTTLECGVDTWTDPGATATDGEGNSLQVSTFNSGSDGYGPGPNTAAEGTYPVQYLAIDADGNTASAVRTVEVNDSRAPTLTLLGDLELTHQCGSNFNDPGFTASDECYPSISVTRTGSVNGWVEGTYTVQYDVQDGAGNAAASVTRTVHVVDCPVY